jgi:hypothetical protein
MRNYPKCRICGKPTKYYQSTAHLKCIKGKGHHCHRRQKPFIQISKKGEIISYWNSLGEIQRLLGIRPYHIQRVLHGKFKTFKGSYWRYAQT